MAFSINTNSSAMAAVRSLNTISNDMQKTQARVETGLKINQAKDDPAVFAITQKMRADIKGMDAVKDSLAFGKATLSTANTGIKTISDELGKLKETVLKGSQQGLDVAKINEQISKALSNIDGFAKSSTYNGVNLLVDSADAPATVSHSALGVIKDLSGSTISIGNQDSTAKGLGLAGLTVDQGQMSVKFDQSMAFANGNSMSVVDKAGKTHTFEFNDGTALLTSQPNDTTSVKAVQFDSATQSPMEGLNAMAQAMSDAGFGARVEGNQLIVSGAIDTAASVAATTSAGTGATVATVNASATTAIETIDAAIDLLGTKMATLGAASSQVEGMQDFSKALQDSLKEGLGALVDADLAEESAKLTALQTKQQLAVQSLSIANQNSQSLTSLFRG